MNEHTTMSAGPLWITPFLAVSDPGTALSFYEPAFGFQRAIVTEVMCLGRLIIGSEHPGFQRQRIRDVRARRYAG